MRHGVTGPSISRVWLGPLEVVGVDWLPLPVSENAGAAWGLSGPGPDEDAQPPHREE